MSHYCHAIDCQVVVPPRLLMCRRHWRMVPAAAQREVWKHYRPGQEKDKKPTAEYLKAMANAVRVVAVAEGQQLTTMWVVYDHPKDQPDHWVAREWLVVNGRKMFSRLAALCSSLEQARSTIPSGLTNIGRHAEDDSVIHEVWL